MDDFLKWFLDNWPTIGSAVLSVFLSAAAFLVYHFKIKTEKAKNAVLTAQLNDAIRRATYTECPNCGAHVKLEDLKWYLPTGEQDQNLNGIADDKEN